jgi:hypothetical protein
VIEICIDLEASMQLLEKSVQRLWICVRTTLCSGYV